MQAYSLLVDPTLTEADLASVGGSEALPDGWSFAARVLDQDLDASAKEGIATYQRLESPS